MHEDTSPTMFALESWYQNAPQLDATAFAAALEKALGKIDIVSSSENSWTFALRDYPIQTDDGKSIFAMLSLMRPDHEQPFYHEARRSALEQSWDYPEAATELQNSRHSLLMHELLARKLLPAVKKVYRSAMAELSTNKLTEALETAYHRHQPPLVQGHSIKLQYAHQGGRNPPHIIIHGTRTTNVPDSYTTYLSKFFRKQFKLHGTPIRISYRDKANPYANE